jgi:broad specificity phosphatase PhoE
MMKRFPTFNTEGLTEEDEIWRPNYNETKAEVLARATRFLDHVFDHDPNTCMSVLSCLGLA